MHFFAGLCGLVFAVSLSSAVLPESPQMPFSFVENRGQAAASVRYIGNGPQFRAWFRDDGVTLQQGSATVQVRFESGSRNPRIEPASPFGAVTNYILGNDPAKWRTGLRMFGLLRYQGVWPGIEVRFRAEQSRAKAEYLVAPGASVDEIRLRFDGDPQIQPDGSLVVKGQSGEFREDRPVLFQQSGEEKTPVEGAFRKFPDGAIGFTAGAYDRHRPLTVDPTLLFSGYFGGYSQTTITSLAVNSSYSVIAAGWTVGTDFSTARSLFPVEAGGIDGFIAAFSPAGGALLYCTYLGGSGDDRVFGVAVDSANNTYVTGWTQSGNFPTLNPFQSKLKGTRDAFIAKLNASGTALIYSTYLGGTGVDSGNAIVLDSGNAPIIAGDTTSSALPVTTGAFQVKPGGNQDAFVAKLNTAGTGLAFLTYFGGSAAEHATSVKTDAANAVYFVGSTWSTNLPILNAAQPYNAGGQDGFLTKLSADGRSLGFSTYVGGSGGWAGAPEQVNSVFVRSNGTAWIGGVTSSRDFPITSITSQSTYGGGQTDGFFCRYLANGALARSSYFGGSLDDSVTGVTTDYYGTGYITGYTTSNDLPVLNPVQSANGGGMDAFVAKLISGQLYYSTYLGGGGNDAANAIAIDSLNNIVIGGTTGSGNFPVTGALATSGGPVSGFVSKLVASFRLAAVNPPNFYLDVWHIAGYNGILNTTTFGASGDIPVSGDWDGSGAKRLGIFRKGTWILDINGNGVIDAPDKTVQFGQAGDLPVVGDWNGTGKLKLGLFRQGTFILDYSGHLSGTATGEADQIVAFGLPGDVPVSSDWNQTGTSKIGVFRNGQWIVDYAGTHTASQIYSFGQAGDIPVIGDWDGSGLQKIGVYRQGVWILDYGGNNSLTGGAPLYIAFGGAGYIPLAW